MRSFKCVSCGKITEVARGTNQRGRDMKCPDCGGSLCRNHGAITATQGRSGGMFTPGAGGGRRGCGAGRGRGGQGGCRRAI